MTTSDVNSDSKTRVQAMFRVGLVVFLVGATLAWFLISLLINVVVPDAFSLALFGLGTFLCAILGFWMGLGSAWWRWIVIAPASPMMGLVLGFQDLTAPEYHIFCLSIIGIVGLTSCVLRFWKGSLQVVTDQEDRTDALQFGIKDIFIWTTAIALFLGVGRFAMNYLEAFGTNLNQTSVFPTVVALALCISIAIVVNIWAMLGSRFSILKVITVILVTLFAMASSVYLIPVDYFFAFVILIAQGLIVFTMFALRMQGYRFVRRILVSGKANLV